MALKKIRTNKKGIVSTYHMIAAIKVTDRIEVAIKSYTEESYRQLEKTIAENQSLRQKLEEQLLKEVVKENPDQELINSLNQQINSIDVESKDYSVDIMNYRMPFNKEDVLSYSAIYEKLKTEAIFAGAEDC